LNLAARLDPNFAMTYAHRGNVFLLQGDNADAANQFRRALALDPDNHEARVGLSKVAQ
jgi:Tfp pilus assembly protein PilF